MKTVRFLEKPALKVTQIVISAYEEEDISYGMRIDNLWKNALKLAETYNVELDFETFEKCLLYLIHRTLPLTVPSEGISKSEQKIIHDWLRDCYYHYIYFNHRLIERYGI